MNLKIKLLVLLIFVIIMSGCNKTIHTEKPKEWEIVSTMTSPNRFNFVGFINKEIGVTVGESGYVYYTADGGKNWTYADNNSDGRYALDFLNTRIICSGGSSGVVMTSEDSGSKWVPGSTDFELDYKDNNIKFLSMISSDTYWVASTAKIGSTNDAGQTWNTTTLPPEVIQIVGMQFNSKETGYLLDTSGTLYKTSDAGINWSSSRIEEIGKGIPAYSSPTSVINFTNELNGFIVFINAQLEMKSLFTNDGGLTWQSVTMPEVKWGHVYLSKEGLLTISNTGSSNITLLTLN